MCNCKYCGKEFENYRQIISHRRHCKNNPNYEKNLELSKLALQKGIKTIQQNAKIDPLNKINEYQFKCIKCGKLYTLLIKERDYLKGNYRKTCSNICANGHIGLTKGKTKICKCIKCGNNFETSLHRSEKNFICNDCKNILYKKIVINKTDTGIIKKLKNVCILTKSTCSDECYFYKNNICLKTKNSIIQKLNTLSKYFGFDISNCIDEQHAINEFNRIKQIIQNDINNGLSCIDICVKYTGSAKKGTTIFGILGVNIRSLKDAIKNSILMGKGNNEHTNQFKSEHHKTWNNKEYYLRSSYETDYANELDENHINYEVEELRIKYFDTQKNEYRCAIPDFYLPDTNTIVEIKSDYTLNIQEMKDKVKAYKDLGYDFKLILEHQEVDLNNLKQND